MSNYTHTHTHTIFVKLTPHLLIFFRILLWSIKTFNLNLDIKQRFFCFFLRRKTTLETQLGYISENNSVFIGLTNLSSISFVPTLLKAPGIEQSTKQTNLSALMEFTFQWEKLIPPLLLKHFEANLLQI